MMARIIWVPVATTVEHAALARRVH